MAEEENVNQEEQAPEEQASEEQPAAEEQAEQPEVAAEEVPAEEPAAEEPVAEEPAEEPAADAPAADAPAEEPAAEGGEAAPAADEDEGLDWKTRRRLQRSRQSGAAGPQRSAEERVRERGERRREAAAKRARYRKAQRAKHERGEGTAPVERASVARKVRQGVVVSSKPDKTITVRIDIARRHRTYEKIVRRSTTVHAHDERNEAGEGDRVRLVETRALSRTKRWRLAEILEKAK